MKTYTELLNMFEKEDELWKKQLDRLLKQVYYWIDKSIDDCHYGTWQRLQFIDQAMKISDKMYSLDSKHKKFLMKWDKKLYRAIIRDNLKKIWA